MSKPALSPSWPTSRPPTRSSHRPSSRPIRSIDHQAGGRHLHHRPGHGRSVHPSWTWTATSASTTPVPTSHVMAISSLASTISASTRWASRAWRTWTSPATSRRCTPWPFAPTSCWRSPSGTRPRRRSPSMKYVIPQPGRMHRHGHRRLRAAGAGRQGRHGLCRDGLHHAEFTKSGSTPRLHLCVQRRRLYAGLEFPARLPTQYLE